MKYLFSAILLGMCLILESVSYAQNDSNDGLVLTYNPPKNLGELNAGQLKKLEARVMTILTKNGIASQGEFSPFIVTPSVNFYESEVVEGLRKLYVMKGDFGLTVGLKSGEAFTSETVEIIGSGTNEAQAKNNFINKISSKANSFQDLFSQATDEVTTYYANNCDQIISEVTNLRNTEKYEGALIRLLSIPSYAKGCHAKASTLIAEAYQEYQDRNCERLINIAQSAIALRHYDAAVGALIQINPQSSCYEKSLPLKEDITAATQNHYDNMWQMQQDILQSYTTILQAKYQNQSGSATPAIHIITPVQAAGTNSTVVYNTRVAIHGQVINAQNAQKLFIDGLETTWDSEGEFNRTLLLDTEEKTVRVEVISQSGNTSAKELYLKRSSNSTPDVVNQPSVNAANLTKVALVVGNNQYEESALRNAVNDALSMESALASLGFQVTKAIDADSKTMREKIPAFVAQANRADVSLFYYSGHGLEINGINYLVPVDNATGGIDKYININEVLEKIQSSSERDLNVVILDACRSSNFISAKDAERIGLATISPPTGTLIAYATAPGETSSDGTSAEGNGVYTGQLIKQIVLPQRIEDVFLNTRKAVMERTNNQQRPWEEMSLNNVFYLKAN
ncbi:caspase family protein [Tunicatimonas pelagia]|uniref:caspase family protein n=1 Tax=Tunicatimonas pelagia TaxID=931531 RepID=UPI0026650420|nr:caspase family protein [Tunicatimonas pelagia]WKN45255.1 caspase family protein [Tunicatimonas pelagia]